MGQLGFLFVLPVFLQNGAHLSAFENGLWLVPAGGFIVLGAQLGGRLARTVGTTIVVRYGAALMAAGMLAVAYAITPRVSLVALLPGFGLFGVGLGLASAQLPNVILADVPDTHSGVAGGASAMARQIGAAIGVAVVGTILSTQTIRLALHELGTSSLSPGLKREAIAQVHASGVPLVEPLDASTVEAAEIDATLASSLAGGARIALVAAAAIVSIGALVALLLPRRRTGAHEVTDHRPVGT